MAWRGLHLTKPARLSLADGQVVVAQAESEVRLAVEDIAWVVIDTPQVTLTTALISACMNAGVVLVTTDAQHLPSGVTLPYHRRHRQAEVAALQLNATLPLRKRLWQVLVRGKINNQADALEGCGGDARALRAMANLVASGDPDNVEARAARDYWGRLFREFTRERGSDKRNMLLNYGYAVLRSGVARGAVASGLLPAVGVNHASSTNPFNLADDLVEPFRPFVDTLVWEMSERGVVSDGEPSVAERQRLASILLSNCRIGTEQVSLLVATERISETLVRAFESGSPVLLQVPCFVT